MLFNSYEFIVGFLPLIFIFYFTFNRLRFTVASKLLLICASLFFYGYWNPIYLLLITASIIFNFTLGTVLAKKWENHFNKKTTLILAITANLLSLAYYKYMDFFLANLNYLAGIKLSLLNVALPLGISFFTFTQIAYLVDSYKGEARDYNIINYSLFVTFFPHLLAGPIIHHKEMMPQFDRMRNKTFNSDNLSRGVFLFFIGLFKKTVIADMLSLWANSGFDNSAYLTLFEAWATSLSYTLQIYFDFSGYTDMALGSALMFNIKLPINFNSPYKAVSIQDFWRRWHITLGRFMRDYIYIPLGGNKLKESRIIFNLMVTFLIGGLWHGAGWTFVLWGFFHGSAIIIERIWKNLNTSMPRFVAWFITFNFVNVTWVFFRAQSFQEALNVIKAMFGLNGIALPEPLMYRFAILKQRGFVFRGIMENLGSAKEIVPAIGLFILLSLLFNNSNEMVSKFKPSILTLIFLSFITVFSILHLSKYSEFLYFRF